MCAKSGILAETRCHLAFCFSKEADFDKTRREKRVVDTDQTEEGMDSRFLGGDLKVGHLLPLKFGRTN